MIPFLAGLAAGAVVTAAISFALVSRMVGRAFRR